MRTLLIIAALALVGCGDKPKAVADFGAAQLARAAVAAERACAAAGFEDLPSCAESPAQDVRRAAKTAMEMEATYTRLCAADLRREKCDDMLMSAYFVAKK
ncbi:hypothetical protein [Variovorax sp. GT1P44]|uniref:hypothetical protein n=1 Tax=Variovorax sp. GT1P44 TaxID=3443742 RepID=UPI003F462A04